MTHWINRLLSPLGVTLKKKSSLDALQAILWDAQQQNTTLVRQMEEQVQLNEQCQQRNTALTQRVEDVIRINSENLNETRAILGNLVRDQEQKNLHELEFAMFSRWQLMDRLEEVAPYPAREVCPLCGEALPNNLKEYRTECIFHGGRLVRYQCPYCDVIFGPEKMLNLSPYALGEEYKWHYSFCNEGASLEKELRAFHELKPRRDGCYLNYGAGRWSQTTEILRNEGWNVFDYEPYAAETGEAVIRDRQKLAKMKFDGIFSQDLMEHLRNPIDELRFMSSLLNPGGVMNHVTGCWEYMYEYTRFHLFFFLGRSREVLASRAGMHLVSYKQEILEGLMPYYSCLFSLPEGVHKNYHGEEAIQEGV